MLWEMGFSLPRLTNQKFKKSENQQIMQTFFHFSMPVSSRHKTQKNNISGLGFYASGKHEFAKTGTNSEFSDFPIFRLRASYIRQSFRILKAAEWAKHQSVGNPQEMTHLPHNFW